MANSPRWFIHEVMFWSMYGHDFEGRSIEKVYAVKLDAGLTLFDVQLDKLPPFWQEVQTEHAGLDLDPRLVAHRDDPKRLRLLQGQARLKSISESLLENVVIEGPKDDFPKLRSALEKIKSQADLPLSAARKERLKEAMDLRDRMAEFDRYREKWDQSEKVQRKVAIKELRLHASLGHFTAHGIRIDTPDAGAFNPHEVQRLFDERKSKRPQPEPVLSDFWDAADIDWRRSRVSVDDIHYVRVTFDSGLIKEQYGDPATEPKGVGRKTKRWGPLMSEAIRHSREQGEGLKQEALATHLRVWYGGKFGDEIGLTTIKKRLKTYREKGLLK